MTLSDMNRIRAKKILRLKVWTYVEENAFDQVWISTDHINKKRKLMDIVETFSLVQACLSLWNPVVSIINNKLQTDITVKVWHCRSLRSKPIQNILEGYEKALYGTLR